jgi:hypothetical protein
MRFPYLGSGRISREPMTLLLDIAVSQFLFW